MYKNTTSRGLQLLPSRRFNVIRPPVTRDSHATISCHLNPTTSADTYPTRKTLGGGEGWLGVSTNRPKL